MEWNHKQPHVALGKLVIHTCTFPALLLMAAGPTPAYIRVKAMLHDIGKYVLHDVFGLALRLGLALGLDWKKNHNEKRYTYVDGPQWGVEWGRGSRRKLRRCDVQEQVHHV